MTREVLRETLRAVQIAGYGGRAERSDVLDCFQRGYVTATTPEGGGLELTDEGRRELARLAPPMARARWVRAVWVQS